jgi:XTP/dITP diphosphohydrolase
MSRTVVVLPVGGVLPVAALPVLRATALVFADATVPEKVAIAAGAVADTPSGPDWVLLTTDLTQAPEADEVIGAPRGTSLLDAAAVRDRLRSPGGCPWDAEQTHESLLPYLVEECYELYQAIEDGDGVAVREELGDVLLQVLFHARVAAELGSQPSGAEGESSFDIDDVAPIGGQAGRPAPVFAEPSGSTPRSGSTAGRAQAGREAARLQRGRRAVGQPAVALAAKLTSRTARAGLPADLLPTGGSGERCSPTRRGRSWPRRTGCAARPVGSPTTSAPGTLGRTGPTCTRSTPTPGAPTGRRADSRPRRPETLRQKLARLVSDRALRSRWPSTAAAQAGGGTRRTRCAGCTPSSRRCASARCIGTVRLRVADEADEEQAGIEVPASSLRPRAAAPRILIPFMTRSTRAGRARRAG